MPELDLVHEIKAEIGRIGGDARREIRASAHENKTYADALHAATSSRLDEVEKSASRIAGIEDMVERIATALNRRQMDGSPMVNSETPESKAFAAYLRRGKEALGPDEVKLLSVSVDSAGGWLAPPQFVTELVRAQREASPIRRLSRNMETTAGSIEIPRQTEHTTAYWVGETEQRQESDLAFGMTTIPLHELATFVDVTLRLLEDATFSVENILAQDLGESFAAAEGTAFLVGSGIKQPVGLLTDAAGVPTVNSGHATEITPDSLIALLYSVPAQYRRTATWMMSTDTMRVIRQLKDGSDRYLWADPAAGLVSGQPGTLLGRPVEVDDSMPSIAAGAYPVVFGDFSRAHWVLSRPSAGVSILRDDFTIRGSGKVRFHARQRVGAGVVRADALRKLKVAA
jgi:HK97 family phage major capsid protein